MFARLKHIATRCKDAIKRPLDPDDQEALYALGTQLVVAAWDGHISDEELDAIHEALTTLRKARHDTGESK